MGAAVRMEMDMSCVSWGRWSTESWLPRREMIETTLWLTTCCFLFCFQSLLLSPPLVPTPGSGTKLQVSSLHCQGSKRTTGHFCILSWPASILYRRTQAVQFSLSTCNVSHVRSSHNRKVIDSGKRTSINLTFQSEFQNGKEWLSSHSELFFFSF